MSLSIQPLIPTCVKDPRCVLGSYKTFPVLKSGSQTTFKSFTTTSVSSSSITFSAPPPSSSIIIDRIVYLYIPVRLTFTGIPALGNRLLNASNDAPRAYPLHSSIETMSATINNQTMSMQTAEIIQAMMHYNVNSDLKTKMQSMTPTYQDQTQSYNDIPIGSRNPLSLYQDSIDGGQMARGAFPFVIISNPVQAGVGVITAVVDVAFCEPLMLSPFFSGNSNDTGFINVNTMDFNFQFLTQAANRMWSHNQTGVTGVPFTSSSFAFGGTPGGPTTPFVSGGQPQLFFQYITPQDTMIIPKNIPITYPYFNTLAFATDLQNIGAGVSNNFTSNNVQLNSIPLRMYIYVREKNADLYSSASNTDTYFRINSLNIQFLNSSGLLSSANFNSLYDMSRRNGCQLSFSQFGNSVQNSNFTSSYGTVGSIICLDLAKDIGLPSLLAPGCLSQTMVQIQCNATNISGRAINPSLYLVCINSGTFTIEGPGQSNLQIGVITPEDVLNCHGNGEVNYNDVYDQAFSGGDFWSGLKDFGSKMLPYLQQAHDFVKSNKLVSTVLEQIPHPTAQKFAQIARQTGYGYGGVQAGVQAGGASLQRKDLRKRLAQY